MGEAQPGRSCPIAGIGASAGGLEALSTLLRQLPPDPGVALVVVQHLDPKHDSSLVELLSRVTSLPVVEASDAMSIVSNHVYVIPPNAGMVVSGGVLKLNLRAPGPVPQRPIDQFFRSLARECSSHAIGVVLSGTGSDGTQGLEAIQAEGGITFAQDASATYDGMPRSAIAAGCADYVLSPAAIADELTRIGRLPATGPGSVGAGPQPGEGPDESLMPIFALLRVACGVDFTHYKQSTIRRRIHRRMVVHRLERLPEYVAYVEEHPEEAAALYQDMLIHVTSFFRDPASFEALARTVFPSLLNSRQPDAPIRVWVPGCATGEEVYSLAIRLIEFLSATQSAVPIKLFGTDISEEVLVKARAGRYPESIASDIPPPLLLRYFVRLAEGGYQISKAVREQCVFARQDAIRDPPFSNLDLISCRNVLIYLGPVLQKRLFPMFHYALREDGYLLLGKSETVGSPSELFSVVDGPNRIYQRNNVPSRLNFEATGRESAIGATPGGQPAPMRISSGRELQREADRVVLARYAPPGVVIDESMEIMQFRGNTGAFLSPAAGAPSNNLLKMVREGLLPELRAAIEQARHEDARVRRPGAQIRMDGEWVDVVLEVVPFRAPPSPERRFVVLFEVAGAPATGSPPSVPAATGQGEAARSEGSERVAQLERELVATRETLNETIERNEASKEELSAASEEILSSNEELQSTNEELLTAKEELQATNEELTTINEELQHRNQEANRLGSDLTNLLTSISIPIIMLGRDLCIRRVTPSACKLLNLLPSDVGRPFTDINIRVRIPDLEQLVVETVDSLSTQEREVQDLDGRFHALAIRPYRTLDGKVDGAVLTLTDIDAIKRGERQIREAREFAESIVAAVRNALVVLDERLLVRSANAAYYELLRTAPVHVEGQSLWSISDGLWNQPRLRESVEELRERGTAFEQLELSSVFPELGNRILHLDGRRVQQGSDGRLLMLLAIQDVTDRRRQEESRLALERKLQDTQRLESLGVLAGGIAHDFNNILTAILGYANLASLEMPAGSPALACMSKIEEGSRRAADLCAQMLAYSGKGRFVVARHDLNAMARETMRLMSVSIGRHAQLRFQPAPESPAVVVDATQIRQVLMNLLINASEAIGEKAGTISISTGVIELGAEALRELPAYGADVEPGKYAYLEVQDTGSGMTPEIRMRIFDPFFTTKFTGRGLGLAAVLGIVRSHEGAIQIDSAPGRGTRFRVLLPLASSLGNLATVEATAAAAAGPALGAPWRGTGTILVVDDEDDVRSVVSRILALMGFDVLQARDGPSAIELLRNHQGKVEVVLLDLTMPAMGGVEVFGELRKLRPELPVILMSGFDPQEAASGLVGEGFAGFLRKPFWVADLAARVRSAMKLD